VTENNNIALSGRSIPNVSNSRDSDISCPRRNQSGAVETEDQRPVTWIVYHPLWLCHRAKT
jgi:hypothetical protein